MKLTDIKGIGKVKEKLLNNLNIFTVKDLLYNKPRSYEDRRSFVKLSEAVKQKKACLIKAKIIDHIIIRGRKQKILKLIISDNSLNAALVCFNQLYLEKQYPVGVDIIVYGKFDFRFDEAQCSNFELIKDIDINESFEFGKIIPIYNLTEGLHQKFMRNITHYALSMMDKNKNITELIPQYIRNKNDLYKINDALWQLHYPSEQTNVIKAYKRLKYEELFRLQFILRLKKQYYNNRNKKAYSSADLSRKIINDFHFKLTKGQKNALKDIKDDLFSEKIMNRLIQGDVGSGKTLVAMIAMALTHENHYQSAFMAPTEVLAVQQHKTLKNILKPYNIKVDILYSSMPQPAKKLALYNLKEGKTNIMVGTHSLFSENVEYKNLGLVVIDEQHKFGVKQRISLIKKGENVNVLVMTATPIPRTISQTLYGDMQTSYIIDKPKNRKPIKTKVYFHEERIKVINFILEQIAEGKQAYIIYPLIEESNKVNLSSAVDMYKRLKEEYFTNTNIGLLHGKLTTEEKRKIMDDFINNEIKILISTTVVEVGVDNPNATVMMIEHAERFGLAQLHQLRGRIGRGIDKSYCFLLVNKNISDEGKERMRSMVKYNDGFKIAEKDLEIRGAGEFFGLKQSGISDFKFTDLSKDSDVLDMCIKDIENIFEDDPELENSKNKTLHKLKNEYDNDLKYLIHN